MENKTKRIVYIIRKNEFNGDLFLYYPGLKPLLSHLSWVAVSSAKPFNGECVPQGFFKSQEKSLITNIKYFGFKNLRKILWV